MTRGSGRIELKYAVPEDVAAHVLSIGLAFLDPEIHAAELRQRITSLYLDTPQRTFLRWHRARAADRFKLRLRRYGEAVDARIFAEVKRKTNSVVNKRRAPIPAGAVFDLLSGSRLPYARLTALESEHLAEFVRQRLRFGAKPEVLVTCVRESLRGSFPEEENAITVDRDIRFQRMTEASLVGDPSIWTAVPLPRVSRMGTAIVELKYSRRPPAWMTPLIMRLASARVSFSKYDVAMRHLCGER
jgi:hypothetical protein